MEGAAGEGAAVEASPPNETAPLPPNPFAEELPPDFWGDEIELPELPPSAQKGAETSFDDPAPLPRTAAKPATTTSPAEGIEADPRFALLQSLFPGFISDWQPSQTPSASPDGALEDAPEPPETVDLEEGLDADESDEES